MLRLRRCAICRRPPDPRGAHDRQVDDRDQGCDAGDGQYARNALPGRRGAQVRGGRRGARPARNRRCRGRPHRRCARQHPRWLVAAARLEYTGRAGRARRGEGPGGARPAAGAERRATRDERPCPGATGGALVAACAGDAPACRSRPEDLGLAFSRRSGHLDRVFRPTQIIRVVDLETTGQAPPTHGVCEIGWQDVALGEDGKWDIWGEGGQRYVNPGRPIPPLTKAIHHILDAQVADAPYWHDVARPVLDPWPRRVALAAHRADFEQQYCTAALPPGADWICTWKSALRLRPDSPRYST